MLPQMRYFADISRAYKFTLTYKFHLGLLLVFVAKFRTGVHAE